MASNYTGNNPSENIHYNYTVNLRLAPVEYGIHCAKQSFYGLNAFGKYFEYLLPNDGYFLPDVWDGYYHITLAKFWLNRNRDLNSKEKKLVNYVNYYSSPEKHYNSVFPCNFRTTELNVYSGEHRYAEAEGIDFVTLKVQCLNDTLQKLYPFLQIIKSAVQQAGGKWQEKSFEDYLRDLHVTIRKYKGNSSKWSSEFIQGCGVQERVKENPLKFECIALEITQTRRQARYRGLLQGFSGVTGIPLSCTGCHRYFSNDLVGYCQKCRLAEYDHRCSECGTIGIYPTSWPGYCRTCQSYERLAPLWSTEYSNTN